MKIMESIKLGFGAYIGFIIAGMTLFVVMPCLFCGGCGALTTALGTAGNKAGQVELAKRDETLMPKSVEIATLLEAYRGNPVSAENIYGNHLLTVTGGEVLNVDTNSFSGEAYVKLVLPGDKFGFKSVRCNLKSKNDAMSLTPGSTVTVRGVLMGQSTMSVQLRRCEVI